MDVVWSLARTYVHTGVAALFAWLVTDLGLKLPAEWPAALEVVLWGLVMAVAVAGLRWLETRRGDGFLATLARRAAAVLTVGLSTKQPAYYPAPTVNRHPVWRDN